MSSQPQIDDEDDFGVHISEADSVKKRSGDKRTFGDLDEEEGDMFGSKKRELEAAQSEIQKWHYAFQNVPASPVGTSPEPGLVVTFLHNLKSSEESLKEKLDKAKRREAAFIVAYAKREQESAVLKSVVRDLKKELRPPSIQTRRLLLDPAIHEEFTRLKTLIEEKEKKIKELQDNVAAVNFSANSRMGKKLMAKCRTLQEENEEIGAMASEGKIHELVMKIAVLKSQNTELRDQFEALHKHMDELANNMERSNEMVFILQDELEAKDYKLERLKDEVRRTKEMIDMKESETEQITESNDDKKAADDLGSPEVQIEQIIESNDDKKAADSPEVEIVQIIESNDDKKAADDLDSPKVEIET